MKELEDGTWFSRRILIEEKNGVSLYVFVRADGFGNAVVRFEVEEKFLLPNDKCISYEKLNAAITAYNMACDKSAPVRDGERK